MPMAAIVNVHLWFDRPVAPWSFAAFAGCELQWVFNRTRIGSGSGCEHTRDDRPDQDRAVVLGRGAVHDRHDVFDAVVVGLEAAEELDVVDRAVAPVVISGAE